MQTTPTELSLAYPYVTRLGENPPYKGGCPKIGSDRRGGMNQNTPNPRLVLRWPHPRDLTLWIGHGHYSQNNPKPRWYWTPGVAAGKEWRWEKSPLQMGIMLNSRGERMTKALEGTEVEQQTPSKWGWETSGEQAVMAFHTRSSVALGDYPRWGGWHLINLITMHNNDLIWYALLNNLNMTLDPLKLST